MLCKEWAEGAKLSCWCEAAALLHSSSSVLVLLQCVGLGTDGSSGCSRLVECSRFSTPPRPTAPHLSKEALQWRAL